LINVGSSGRDHFLFPAIVCLATAEVLIYRKKFFGTGIDTGLWSAALVMLIASLPSSGRVEAILVFALAAAIVGARMRSATFGCIAAILVVSYCCAKWPEVPIVAIAVACTIAAAAALARLREWQRPSTEELFGFVVVALPIAGEIGAQSRTGYAGSIAGAACFAVLAVVLLAMGLPRRDRHVVIAGAISLALVAIELRSFIRLVMEVKLMLAGAAMIAAAVAISRALRGRSAGFVVAPEEATQIDDAVQMIGTFAAAHPVAHAPQGPERQSGGGAFGGAGASGDF